MTATLSYWHLSADAEGVSSFRKAGLAFAALPAPGLDDPPLAAVLRSVGDAAFLRLEPGQVEDWHPAPRRLFLLVVQGRSRVTAGDGTVKEFGPGDVVLMDDTHGRGHVTEALGDTAHVALVIGASPPE